MTFTKCLQARTEFLHIKYKQFRNTFKFWISHQYLYSNNKDKLSLKTKFWNILTEKCMEITCSSILPHSTGSSKHERWLLTVTSAWYFRLFSTASYNAALLYTVIWFNHSEITTQYNHMQKYCYRKLLFTQSDSHK